MDYEPWITEYYGDVMSKIDAECRSASLNDLYPIFSRITDPALWNILLWKSYSGYENVKAALPGFPDAARQKQWAGTSGMDLGANVVILYRNLQDQIRKHSRVELQSVRFLDFGCGWGNVSRYFAKDVPAAQMFACDPHAGILETASSLNRYITFAQSDSLPERIPFDGLFNVAISISIWTHLTEKASEMCLNALHQSLRKGGLLLLTVRPPVPQFIHGGDPEEIKRSLAEHGFWCHADAYPVNGENTYGNSVITMDYIRSHWTDRFDLLDTAIFSPSPGQMLLTLRRR
jgi:SAM-dependent methyltransferase